MSFEEDDVSKIYEYTDLVRNTERTEIAGKERIVLLPSLELLRTSLTSIEAMVRDIEVSTGEAGFEIGPNKWGRPIVVPKPLGKSYFYAVKTFFQHYAYAERYVYSVYVSALCEAFEALGLHPLTFAFRDPGLVERSTGKTHGETFNEVVKKVAEIVGTKQFRERMRVRRRNAERNEAKGLAIEQQVFENKARQLVLILHFGYQEQHRMRMTLEEVQAHRKKFFNNCRSNKLLRGIVDYIWKLEEGDESGLHLHLHVLIFYTADSCRDVYIAKQLGEYWVKVTGDKGQYWNSNANKLFHEKHGHGVGTGEINWDDGAKREALRTNIRYMTKADQFLKLKYGEHCRVFGTSQVKEKKKPGRPRTAKLKGDSAGNAKADPFDSESIEETGVGATNPDADQSE